MPKRGILKRNQRRSIRQCNRQGSTLVELAQTLPILLLILFACYEFGRANMIRHTAQAAAYEAARVGIVPGATVDEIRDAAAFILGTIGVRNFEVSILPTPITDQTEKVQVTVSTSMRENSSLGLLFNENSVYQGTCELTRETF